MLDYVFAQWDIKIANKVGEEGASRTKNREYDILEDATPCPSSALAAFASRGHAAVAAVIAL